MQKALMESHEKAFTVVSENKDELIVVVFKIEPSLFKVINDMKDSDKVLYKDVAIEVVDAPQVAQTNIANAEESKEEKKI